MINTTDIKIEHGYIYAVKTLANGAGGNVCLSGILWHNIHLFIYEIQDNNKFHNAKHTHLIWLQFLSLFEVLNIIATY